MGEFHLAIASILAVSSPMADKSTAPPVRIECPPYMGRSSPSLRGKPHKFIASVMEATMMDLETTFPLLSGKKGKEATGRSRFRAMLRTLSNCLSAEWNGHPIVVAVEHKQPQVL